MKKTVLALAMFFVALGINAQDFYVALSGGVTGVTSQKTLRTGGDLKGSYGEGYQGQLRLGYLFDKTFGVDLGVGYLYGSDQQIANSNGLDIVGRARAFGLSLSGLVNLSENVYVRAGLLTKLGGRTDIVGTLEQGPLKIDFERDNHGKFPLGFNAAFGVKFKLNDKWGVFAEMEYQGIDVDADESVLDTYSAYLGGEVLQPAELAQVLATLPVEAQMQIGGLITDKVTYVDNPTPGQPESKSITAPYSSFGLNIGVTYSFDW
ncbi:outer membrane beta-barrel protein [Tenacibaculum sp. IB213877]|uniref:outer membrane beta-barrel protein n=1 Tax=Tenacibaculum sp. IB213877 TaxID=3097351 RepID=UPI002A5A044D|nr:outer membrane beta-barrel protein [Tenacibaculum sp. IB213877]MDY0779464.1 outer membrane beta-barrel protein [Tenacibaculum sp. IB213877]